MKSTNTIAVEESGVCVYIGVRRCTYFTIMKSTTTGVDECGVCVCVYVCMRVCVCVCVYACVCACRRTHVYGVCRCTYFTNEVDYHCS